jgi:hypothetical protein
MTAECDYPKVKSLLKHGTNLISAVQDTFEGRTYRVCGGPVHLGEVYSNEVLFDRHPETATAKNGIAICNYRVVETVHANTVRAVFRRAGKMDKQLFLPGRWYRVIED